MSTFERFIHFTEPVFSKQPMNDATKPEWIKDPFKVQDRPMDDSEPKHRNCTDRISGFTMQLIFKKPCTVFWCSIKLPIKPIQIFPSAGHCVYTCSHSYPGV